MAASQPESVPVSKILNVNVGVLGHVDSGKTSLVKALSTELSTAALDKHPDSRKRGITLDLGFSAFTIDVPEDRKEEFKGYEKIQFTLVDCPGHASLIKTVIGGAAIIDLMILVIDINKGIQTQTAECLIIGEILSDYMIIALNKADLIPKAKRAEKIAKMKKKLQAVFKRTKFGKDIPMIPTIAAPGGGLLHKDGAKKSSDETDIKQLINTLNRTLTVPKRVTKGAFRFAIDHCFQIKGQGTVMTGTVLEGSVSLNDIIEIPSLGIERKVKSMQMFRKPVKSAKQGDRVGICVTNLDSKLLERGVACAPKNIPTISAAIVSVNKVRLFKGEVRTNAKFHCTVGHSTVMATAHFFGNEIELKSQGDIAKKEKNEKKEKKAAAGGKEEKKKKPKKKVPKKYQRVVYPTSFDKTKEYAWHEQLVTDSVKHPPGSQFALLRFDKPITCAIDSMVVGSKLDVSTDAKLCRIAFSGKMLGALKWSETELEEFKIYKTRERIGTVERLQDDYTLIGKGLFSKETDMTQFIGLKVKLDNGLEGSISSSFGQTGKFKVSFVNPIPEEMIHVQGGKGEGRKSKKQKRTVHSKITLPLKKYVFATDRKRLVQ
ncbi:hypothetical protein AAMO2058_001068900 [Amorphochlora amoebiformis]